MNEQPLPEVHHVGIAGFEPATSPPQTARSGQAELYPDVYLASRQHQWRPTWTKMQGSPTRLSTIKIHKSPADMIVEVSCVKRLSTGTQLKTPRELAAAEGKGFEPLVGFYATLVFKTSAISQTLPTFHVEEIF